MTKQFNINQWKNTTKNEHRAPVMSKGTSDVKYNITFRRKALTPGAFLYMCRPNEHILRDG